MLRLRTTVLLALLLGSGIWGCAPRQAPAPVEAGANASSEFMYPRDVSGGIIVQPGDTLYAISRYHQTALQALIEANDLEPPFIIKPGQVLRLPDQAITPTGAPAAPPPPQQIATRQLPPPAPITGQQIPARPPADIPAPHKTTTEAGEKPKPVAVVARANDSTPAQTIVTPRTPVADAAIRAGTPSLDEGLADDPPPPQPRPAPGRKPVTQEKISSAPPVRTATAAVPAPAPPAARKVNRNMRFLWPASGPILSDFGPKPNGLHNDGINIAMPPNGPIVAAADGIVSYAGNGLRGYGNLLLIRHEGGWVTAYAHNSELLVEKGARVHRGQIIARAGRSGGVTQDQLHFELRAGAKPVDPKPMLVGG